MTQFDVRRLSASDLDGLTDSQFRDVVDADLRRRVNPDGIPAEVSEALRSRVHVHHWMRVLQGILRSVDGQLRAADDEYESIAGPLQARVDHDEAGARQELVDLTSEYRRRRASRERFRTGVEEHIVVAEQIIAEERAELADSDVAAERDGYARRILELERAIRAHRKAALADLNDEEPAPYETALWAALDE